MKLAVLLLLSVSTFAQVQMFKVENPKNDKSYNEVEAVRAYWYAVETVRSEYHIQDTLAITFTLELGADKDLAEFKTNTVHLRQWDKAKFRQGVMFLALNELTDPKNIERLERRIAAQEAAQVDWKALKK